MRQVSSFFLFFQFSAYFRLPLSANSRFEIFLPRTRRFHSKRGRERKRCASAAAFLVGAASECKINYQHEWRLFAELLISGKNLGEQKRHRFQLFVDAFNFPFEGDASRLIINSIRGRQLGDKEVSLWRSAPGIKQIVVEKSIRVDSYGETKGANFFKLKTTLKIMQQYKTYFWYYT